ncbi:hypothetical protein [Tahibacter amnicola]|uniref:Uncharacterized protein n=1 Tax=Tahibacter amnicola TaxID=2976241 RepID=A0ABY6BD16_9GAMM|nr:hypothetical protein [Tahibacter amnicola]UXI65802.1 hypothetical protein N4264_13615 [Tahibacter amnicola]
MADTIWSTTRRAALTAYGCSASVAAHHRNFPNRGWHDLRARSAGIDAATGTFVSSTHIRYPVDSVRMDNKPRAPSDTHRYTLLRYTTCIGTAFWVLVVVAVLADPFTLFFFTWAPFALVAVAIGALTLVTGGVLAVRQSMGWALAALMGAAGSGLAIYALLHPSPGVPCHL